ncbi:DNA oxidative demethylase ALKBH2-like [Maniola jurtina]|uniref:DNA oxidative demethylase ALKBH2-like n=1 Tax=Maniola jurtina TaxID=191418 RepID=UPI001E68E95C|nr:DNA oxidative demethylase ALKBH2-like [Maniola jurtina]
MTQKLEDIDLNSVIWKSTRNEGLDIEYALPIPRAIADAVLQELEETLTYFTGDLATVKVFGKVHPLPRQQVAYGDPGITYRYSGTTVPALPWPQPVLSLRDFLFKLKGIKYDFVLVNKYRNGSDHMGEHRDNEPELDPTMPIASISFGQERPFVLKHKDARKPGPQRKNIYPVMLKLEHGSVLLMNPPTNEVWYHSLPTRKKLLGARINLTFRKMRKNLIK